MTDDYFPTLEGKRFLITGASSGIGRAAAVLLSKSKSTLVLTGRDQARLDETLAGLSGSGHRAMPCDLADTESIGPWFRALIGETGPLDGIVHSAGVFEALPLRFITPGHIDSIMRTNVYSTLMLARYFSQKNSYLPPASIVLMSSSAALVGEPGLAVYSASKAAVAGLTRSLAVELAPQSIRVNCVAPAIVQSEMTDRLRSRLTDEQFAAIEAKHPLGLGNVFDVANTIAFLLSPASRWTTGATMVIDGGYTVG